MNAYRLEELSVGQTASFVRAVTPEMIEYFRQLSGDENPLHTDAAFAAACGFRDRVAYGMLTASLISALAGMYLPGRDCLLMEVESKFAEPVYAGDVLTVRGTVSGIDERFRTIDVRTRIDNARGDKVYRGRYRAGFSERQEAGAGQE